MFYVVYFFEQRQNVVIPMKWVRENEASLELFVNEGLNNNHVYYCFWSERGNALKENGEPDSEFIPRFEMDLANNFPEEGCYLGKLIHFFTNYEDAIEYKGKRRNLMPAIYNPRRLLEQPIPNIVPAAPIGVQADVQHESDDDELLTRSHQATNNNSSEGYLDANNSTSDPEDNESFGLFSEEEENSRHSEDIERSITAIEEIQQQNDGINGENGNTEDNLIMEFKAEPEDIIQVGDDDIRGLYDLLHEDEIHNIDEGCEMIVINGSIPKPIQVNSDDLIKRENDWLSENVPYNDTKDGGRIYAVGQNFIKILPQAIKTFRLWTKYPENTSLLHDKRFVHAILFSCCRQELKNGVEFNPAVIPFARELFRIRTNGDENRLARFDEYVDQKLNKK